MKITHLPITILHVLLLIVGLSFARQTGNISASQTPKLDLLIRGGQVIDGSGAPPMKADVGISGDRITFIGDAAKAGVSAARTIDATGLIVAPGFIDPHTHTAEDLSHPQRKSNEDYLMQGV